MKKNTCFLCPKRVGPSSNAHKLRPLKIEPNLIIKVKLFTTIHYSKIMYKEPPRRKLKLLFERDPASFEKLATASRPFQYSLPEYRLHVLTVIQ